MSVSQLVTALLQIKFSYMRTFSVVTEAHLGLTETDGVFALTDSIELLELGLRDALYAIAVKKGGL